MRTWQVGDIEVTRVDDPGHDLVLPQDDATVRVLQQSPWLRPHFVTAEWALNIGSSATVIHAPDATVVVDPFLAFDDSARLERRLAALRDAGVEPGDVDVVVNTHVDGIGVNVLADATPTFPSARYLVPRAELDALRDGSHGDARGAPLLALWDAGTVDASAGTETITSGVQLEDAPGHNPGHHVVWIESGDQAAVVVGHLFLHPAQIASPANEAGDLDPKVLEQTRRALLDRCATTGATLIGPLFADPGGGTVEPDGDTWRLMVTASGGV